MSKRIFFIISLLLFALASIGFSQTTPPTKKINKRPAAKKPVEPFEKATVAEMEEQCVTLQTEAGNIEIELYPQFAPETVRNFLNLSATGFYDTTTFSRVVPNFVIQGGNFSTRQTKPVEMYPKAMRNIADEPNQIKHEIGVLSMARGDEPNSASTHFFILLSDAKYLDGKFSAFGRVTKGMDVVEKINKAEVVEEKPVKPVRLLKAVVALCPVKTEK